MQMPNGLKTQVFAFASLVISSLAGYAADRAYLRGFQKFSFGMSEDQLLKSGMAVTNRSNDPKRKEDFVSTAAPYTIAGIEYQIGFGFSDKKMVRIALYKEARESAIECKLRFDSIFGMLQSTYGQPDVPPSHAPTHFAKFTFKDGGMIVASTSMLNDFCIVSVNYMQGQGGGNTF